MKLKNWIPVSLKKALKYGFYASQDAINFLKGQKSDYPPRRLNFVGSHDFQNVGKEFFHYFVNLGGLQPTDQVLDIGSGIGRMALPLTKYLDPGGTYEGFDIDKRGVQWCQKNITPKYPNFHFQYVDIHNPYYNRKGKIQSHQFVFPYADKSFDFIFATSVFTHMTNKEIVQYLKEIKRTLKPSGTFFLTFFALDKTAQKNIQRGESQCDLRYTEDDIAFYSHKSMKEAEIGYQENWLREQFKINDLGHHLKIHRGWWSGREDGVSYQDIFIGEG